MSATLTQNSTDKLLARIGLPLPMRDAHGLLSADARWLLLGDQLINAGRAEAGLAALEVACARAPTRQNVVFATASVLLALKRPHAALQRLSALPDTPDTLAVRADVHLTLNECDAALALCDQALAAAPDHVAARLNRGAILRALNRADDVLINDTQLAQAHPTLAVAHYNHGDACLMTADFDTAHAAFTRALHCQVDYAEARMGLGISLAMRRQFDEADACLMAVEKSAPATFARYLANAAQATQMRNIGRTDSTAPTPKTARQIYLAWASQAQNSTGWGERTNLLPVLEAVLADPAASESPDPGLPFQALLLDLTESRQQAVASQLATHYQSLTATWSIQRRASVFTPDAARSRRLRIGFISPDFRAHPVGDCHWRQLQLHDRARFEIYGYSLLHDGGSPARERLVAACDHFADVGQLSSATIAQRIAADGIDILVDLSGYTAHTRPEILAGRPAPIQVQHMGMPGSAGADFIDYRITDHITHPIDWAPWPEHFVRLPDTYWLADDTLPYGEKPTRTSCGLPENSFVFCCFNTHQKIEPSVFEVWMTLLHDVADSVLWLAQGSDISRSNLRHEAQARGIDPARLIFAPHASLDIHIPRHRCADLFLDTFVYNAGVTALLAYWAGLPVLTCLGQTTASRMGASAAQAVGMGELVCASRAHYAARARHLALNPAELIALREQLAEHRLTAPLFQTEARVREIEQAYELMWQRHANGLAPAAFDVR
jgi:protein O-GlcNAc transferase